MTGINYFMPSALCSGLSSEVEELGPLGLFVPSLLKNVVKALLEVGVQDLADQGLCLMCSGFSTWSADRSALVFTFLFEHSVLYVQSVIRIAGSCLLSSHTLVVVGTAVSLYILGKSYERLMKGILVYIFFIFYHNLSLLKKMQLFNWVKKVWMIIWVKLSVEYILTNFVRLCKQEGTILLKKVRLMLNSTPKFQTFNDK